MDPVSVAVERRAAALAGLGLEIHRAAGYIPRPGKRDRVIPALNHLDPEIETFTGVLMDGGSGREALAAELERLAGATATALAPLFGELGDAACFCEDVFSRPAHLPLAVALSRLIEETAVPAVAVHHCTGWDDRRCRRSQLGDVVAGLLPVPPVPVRHLALGERVRRGLERYVDGAVLTWRDCLEDSLDGGEAAALRQQLGVDENDLLLFAPAVGDGTAAALRFAAEMEAASGRPAWLLAAGGNGGPAAPAGERLVTLPGSATPAGDSPERGPGYQLARAYAACDLVVHAGGPCLGNPVLEAAAAGKPLAAAAGAVPEEYRGRGFQFLPLDGRKAARLVAHGELLAEMTERNLEAARRHFPPDDCQQQARELLAAVTAAPRR